MKNSNRHPQNLTVKTHHFLTSLRELLRCEIYFHRKNPEMLLVWLALMWTLYANKG